MQGAGQGAGPSPISPPVVDRTLTVRRLLDAAESGDDTGSSILAEATATTDGSTRLLAKLSREWKRLSATGRARLARQVATSGAFKAMGSGLVAYDSPRSHAATLVVELVESMESEADRVVLSQELARTSQPIEFAGIFVRYAKLTGREREKDGGKASYPVDEAGRALAQRIQNELEGKYGPADPMEIVWNEDFRMMLRIWGEWGSEESARAFTSRLIVRSPRVALGVLGCCVWRGTEVESGKESIHDFGADEYQSLEEIARTEDIYAALKSVFGSIVDSASRDEARGMEADQRLAIQFANTHRWTLEKLRSPEGSKDSKTEAPPQNPQSEGGTQA